MMRVEYGRATDVGLVRAANEDAAVAEYPVFVVADGMGGYQDGALAARLLTEEFATGIGFDTLDQAWIEERIAAANRRVQRTGGGTTAAGVIAVSHDGLPSWLVFNVGDSRVYGRTGGTVSQISVDHSLVQEMVASGMLAPELARVHPERNVVTRAIGTDEDPQADVWLLPAAVGDRYVVCSDGLTGEVEADLIADIIRQDGSPQRVADELVQTALDAGGRDNITVVVVDVLAVDPSPGHRAGAAETAALPTGAMPLGQDAVATRPLSLPLPREGH